MKRFAYAFFGLSIAVLAAAPRPVLAEVPLNGYLIARQACPAYQSIRKLTNPGDISTTVDRAYPLHAKNRPAASHYWITVPGASPERRWVAVSCGEHVIPADGSLVGADSGGSPGAGSPSGGGSVVAAGSAPSFVLAASWQPAFCETRPSKPECGDQTEDRFDGTHFSLHGLWPQPRGVEYCGVSAADKAADKAGRWDDIAALPIAADIREELDKVMPGTRSNLQRHEWVKHGSCYPGASVDEYFRASLMLMEQLNASAVRDLFARSIGEDLNDDDIRGAFDAAFGAGAGQRVRISCANDNGRRLLVELQIALVGEIGEDTPMADLIAAARPASSGCNGGTVDSVGLQ